MGMRRYETAGRRRDDLDDLDSASRAVSKCLQLPSVRAVARAKFRWLQGLFNFFLLALLPLRANRLSYQVIGDPAAVSYDPRVYADFAKGQRESTSRFALIL